jgi:hypothetical protein
MALVIENGTGVSGADSYGTRAGFILHVANYYAGTVPDTDASDVPMRAAFAYLNGLKWKGSRALGRSQVGAWPRDDMTDCDGNDIAIDEIPDEVILAQYDLAWAEMSAPGVLSPSYRLTDAAVTMEKVGEIQVGYDASRYAATYEAMQTRVEAAMRRIDCFIKGKVGVRSFDARVV